MDGFLRPLLSALSSRPELARWLATDDLVRQLAMAIDQAATGASPARDFKVIAPATPFVPAGAARAAPSIRPAIAATTGWCRPSPQSMRRASRRSTDDRPRLDDAYRSLGNQTSNVDRGADQAIDILLDTPVVKDPIAIVVSDTGGGWAYADDELETLKPAQKQLLRMGPANVDRLLVWLRALQACTDLTTCQ